jgi:hypothetical protein
MGLSHFPSKRKIVCGRHVLKKTEILFSKVEKQRKRKTITRNLIITNNLIYLSIFFCVHIPLCFYSFCHLIAVYQPYLRLIYPRELGITKKTITKILEMEKYHKILPGLLSLIALTLQVRLGCVESKLVDQTQNPP